MDCLVFLLIVIFTIFMIGIFVIIAIFMLNLHNCDGIPNHKKIMWFPSPPS